jgi:uncharacterized protein YsxB (DUF464 family)
MTKVIALKKENGYSLILKGHATGSEKVCAAVSGIVYALEGFLNNFPECIKQKKSELKNGEAEFVFFGDERVYYPFMMAIIGLKQIEKSYPEYIRVNFLEK